MHSLSLVFLTLSAYTFNLNPPEVEVLIKKGLEYSYQMDYGRAQECFNEVTKIAPENPCGYFFQAALLQYYMIDFDTFSKEGEFYYYLNQAMEKSQKILKIEENAWAHFYLGAAHIYRATYEGWHRRYFVALREGQRSEPQLKRALALDSTLADAWLGLGTLEYFMARANRYVFGLKLFGDAQRGINNIKKAMEHGRYFNVTAQHSLAWALTEDGKPEEAKAYTQNLLARYPENRVFFWELVNIYLAEKDWDRTIQTVQLLLDNTLKNQPDCHANIATAKLKMAKAYYGRGDYQMVVKLCAEIVEMTGSKDGATSFNDALKDAKRLLKKAQAKLS